MLKKAKTATETFREVPLTKRQQRLVSLCPSVRYKGFVLNCGLQARPSTGLQAPQHPQSLLVLTAAGGASTRQNCFGSTGWSCGKTGRVRHRCITSVPSKGKDGLGKDGHYAVDLSSVSCFEEFTKLPSQRKN